MCDIKFGVLQVRENEISLRKWSVGTAQLHTLEGTRVATTFPKSDIRRLWIEL